MKVRVTLLTENNTPISVLGENPEEKLRKAWEAFAAMVNCAGEDRCTVESVAFVNEEDRA